MSLFDVDSAVTAGIVDALIATETKKKSILLMSELRNASCCEETYNSVDLPSIAPESFEVQLWLRRINLGLEKGVKERFDERRAHLGDGHSAPKRQVRKNACGWEPQLQDGANRRRDYAISVVCTLTPTRLFRSGPKIGRAHV